MDCTEMFSHINFFLENGFTYDEVPLFSQAAKRLIHLPQMAPATVTWVLILTRKQAGGIRWLLKEIFRWKKTNPHFTWSALTSILWNLLQSRHLPFAILSYLSYHCLAAISDFKSLLLVFTFPLPLRAWGHCHDRHLSNFMSRCSKPKPKRQIPWIEKCSNKGMIEVVSEGFYHKFIIITPDHHHHHNHHHHLHHHHLVPPRQLCKDASHPLCPPSPL